MRDLSQPPGRQSIYLQTDRGCVAGSHTGIAVLWPPLRSCFLVRRIDMFPEAATAVSAVKVAAPPEGLDLDVTLTLEKLSYDIRAR
jgi:hypothetical protein